LRGKGGSLLRVTALIIVVGAVGILLLWQTSEEPIRALETPELRPAPGIFAVSQSASERTRKFEEMRIGSFEPPEEVPGYEVLEKRPTGSDGTRSAQLLVDTRSRSQEDFTLITRDLKARYADYDFVSVEFTDSSVLLDYQGGAIIVNTPLGASQAGFIYAPPNKGYLVKADD
jgi:hypothetical protein